MAPFSWAEVLPALHGRGTPLTSGCAQQDLADVYLFLRIPVALILPDAQALSLKDRGNLPVPNGILSFSIGSYHSLYQICVWSTLRTDFFLLVAVKVVHRHKDQVNSLSHFPEESSVP